MSYLFSNPQIKKWKTMFFLSFLMNIVLVVVFFLREREVVQNDEPVISKTEENTKEPENNINTANAGNQDTPSTEIPAVHKSIIPGESVKSSVAIEENFFSAFNNSEEVSKLAVNTGIPALSDLLSAHIGRLLMWDLVLRSDVRKNDRIDFVFRVIPDEEKKKRKDMPDLIEITAVIYHSKKYNKDIKIYRYKPENSDVHKYYYYDGQLIEKIIAPFQPVKKYIQVTSLLADRAPKHDGVDFKAEIGTPVYSTVEGTVSRKNWMTKYNGYCIEIEEKGKPFVYKYLHLSEVIADTGQKVKPGDHIANSGNSGKTTAPHLHYQINIGQKGNVVDPFRHHKTTIEKLSGKEEELFRNMVIETDRLLNQS